MLSERRSMLMASASPGTRSAVTMTGSARRDLKYGIRACVLAGAHFYGHRGGRKTHVKKCSGCIHQRESTTSGRKGLGLRPSPGL